MQRRTLLKLGALSAGAMAAEASALGKLAPGAPAVERVLLVTKCHLDVGFTLTQAKVMREYFDVYYPAAMKLAADRRASGGDRYTWTTGSWLLYEYLEQATAAQRAAMEQAIAAGDIAWHALPFSWQTEMLDRSMIAGALGLSAALDARFGRKTTGAKMTDVPGHTRGIIAPLAAGGVRMLDIGINAASTPPEVPDVFLWKDGAGNSLAMLYHRHDYGSVLRIPNSAVAVAVEVRNDNSGPHTPAELDAMYARLRAQFPGARVQAANLTEVAEAVEPVRDQLPVVTGEIGDTWIYGVASDPDKVARYREVARLRSGWLARRQFAVGDATDRQLLRRLLLAVEHTWGTDTKSYLDNSHYRPQDLAAVLGQGGYAVMATSWEEKRDDIATAVASLPAALRPEAQASLAALGTTRPTAAGMKAYDPAKHLETQHFVLGVDATTGALVRLRGKAGGQEWASPEHPLALFTYQTLSSAEFADFLARYIQSKEDWAPRDFGKPGIDAFGAAARAWHPRLRNSWVEENPRETRVLLELSVDDAAALATGNVAWPKEMFLEIRMPHAEARLDLTLTTLGKVANRMPEAMWLTFDPVGSATGRWSLDKVGEEVAPGDVVEGGGRSMHAVAGHLRYRGTAGTVLDVETLDAPLVATGDRTPLNFSRAQPGLAGGVHVGLYNNAWGTNYVQWCGGDWRYRFSLRG